MLDLIGLKMTCLDLIDLKIMCLDLIGLEIMCLYTNVDDRVIYQVVPLNHLFRSL